MSAERESARQAALARYGVLDTPREAVFDRITEMASVIYAAPMAAIALVESDRVWFKSRVGVAAPDIPAMPFNSPQEDFFMPSPQKIAEAMRKLAAY